MAAYDSKKHSTFQSEDPSPMAAGPGTRRKQRKIDLDINTGKLSGVQDDFT